MGIINTWFTPERTRSPLTGRSLGLANILAAFFGGCHSFLLLPWYPTIYLFFQSVVPLAITFSFHITAPMVNYISLTLLFGLFAWKIALLYLFLGLMVAIVACVILGRFNLEKYL